ncbi:MAG: OmpA family protein [candidate division WOR-3 bacterium]|nr:OmpA family protein [candidate division WOR-3 bacterium]
MRKAVIITLAIAMMVTTVIAAPAVTAGNGLLRIQNAATMHKGALGFNIHWAGYPVGAYHYNDGEITTWDGIARLGAGWTPLGFLQLGVVPALAYNRPNTDTDPEIGLWDLEINAKASYTKIPVLKLGVQVKTLLPVGSDAFFPEGYNNGLDLGALALVTSDFGDVVPLPLMVHLNAGYLMTGDDIDGADVTDYIPIGAGLEVDAKYVVLFTELYSNYPLDSDQDADFWLTPGIRLSLPFGMNFDLGMDFLILKQEDDPREDWYHTVTAGVSWATPEKKHVPMGAVAGNVKDAETGAGLVARLSYSGPETGVITAGSMGFKIDSLDPGIYTLEATADGYQDAKKTVTVMDDKVARVELMLKPRMATLSGAVRDRETDAGLPATIRFTDAPIPEVKTDPSTGLYKVEIKPGTYGVEVSSEDYLSQTASVIVDAAGTIRDFNLIKKGMKIAFRGINFETAKTVILPESYPILDEAAKILKENPTIRVEIGGHTDSRGSASYNQNLSQQRAEAVRLYLIQNHSIESNRLLAKGYGESQPVAPNDTEENMAKNRRVEFTILGK